MKAPMERDERMLLAAELVLGLLDDGERAHALELLAQDPGFAEQVRRWEAHLAPLFAGFAPREPSRDLYPDIRARLNRIEAVRTDRFGAATTDSTADRAPAAANENDAQGVAPGWRWAALGSSAAAAATCRRPSRPAHRRRTWCPAAPAECSACTSGFATEWRRWVRISPCSCGSRPARRSPRCTSSCPAALRRRRTGPASQRCGAGRESANAEDQPPHASQSPPPSAGAFLEKPYP